MSKAQYCKKDIQEVLSLDIKCESCGVAHLFFYNIKDTKPRSSLHDETQFYWLDSNFTGYLTLLTHRQLETRFLRLYSLDSIAFSSIIWECEIPYHCDYESYHNLFHSLIVGNFDIGILFSFSKDSKKFKKHLLNVLKQDATIFDNNNKSKGKTKFWGLFKKEDSKKSNSSKTTTIDESEDISSIYKTSQQSFDPSQKNTDSIFTTEDTRTTNSTRNEIPIIHSSQMNCIPVVSKNTMDSSINQTGYTMNSSQIQSQPISSSSYVVPVSVPSKQPSIPSTLNSGQLTSPPLPPTFSSNSSNRIRVSSLPAPPLPPLPSNKQEMNSTLMKESTSNINRDQSKSESHLNPSSSTSTTKPKRWLPKPPVFFKHKNETNNNNNQLNNENTSILDLNSTNTQKDAQSFTQQNNTQSNTCNQSISSNTSSLPKDLLSSIRSFDKKKLNKTPDIQENSAMNVMNTSKKTSNMNTKQISKVTTSVTPTTNNNTIQPSRNDLLKSIQSFDKSKLKHTDTYNNETQNSSTNSAFIHSITPQLNKKDQQYFSMLQSFHNMNETSSSSTSSSYE